MKKCLVTILPENIKTSVDVGTNLIELITGTNIHITSPCGRIGACNKCLVKIIDGSVETDEGYDVSSDYSDGFTVLACKTRVIEDATIEVPYYSRMGKHKVELANKSTNYIKASDYFEFNQINPLCKKYLVELEKPDEMNNISDFERLKSEISRKYNIENVTIGLNTLRKLPTILREGDFKIYVTMVNIKDSYEIVNIGLSDNNLLYALAVDIGTSTVVVSLVEVTKSIIVDSIGTYNGQFEYGSDVISRIIYSEENPDGLSRLNGAIVKTLNTLIEKLLNKHKLNQGDIVTMVCAGNTVMNHLFLSLLPRYLRLEPYVPASSSIMAVKAHEIGIKINLDAVILTLPSVSSYVGGDITAGVLSTMMHKADKITLFIDIGTNGEMVLGNKEWMVTCSCSAGPSLEGAGISCGMRAMEGAIDRVEINKDTWDVTFRVIGNKKPQGICGSGLINAISEMVDSGVIDRAGNLDMPSKSARIRSSEAGGLEFVLVFQAESKEGRDIVITESDIKNFIRAKAAVYAGIRTMLDMMNLNQDVIERVLIAGGFGNHINISHAMNIGLFPNLPVEKYEYVGNTSLQGAATILLSKDALNEIEDIARQMSYIELSIGNKFMEEFISAMFIPHTDLSLFS